MMNIASKYITQMSGAVELTSAIMHEYVLTMVLAESVIITGTKIRCVIAEPAIAGRKIADWRQQVFKRTGVDVLLT